MSPGCILKSIASSEQDYFDEAIVLVTVHNENETIGVIINRPYGCELADLEEFRFAPGLDLFEGGPVQQDHLYFIHQISGIGGEKVNTRIGFGGDFQTALSLIQNGKATHTDIKIFIGYCGWDAGQLEAELEDGAWVVIEKTIAEIFEAAP